MIFDPNFFIKDIAGKPFEGPEDQVHAGKLLANCLYYSNSNQPLKFHSWALKLYNREVLELEISDLNTLSDFVTNSATLTVASKYAILNYIEKIRIDAK